MRFGMSRVALPVPRSTPVSFRADRLPGLPWSVDKSGGITIKALGG
jgi:hypothetical protein